MDPNWNPVFESAQNINGEVLHTTARHNTVFIIFFTDTAQTHFENTCAKHGNKRVIQVP